MDIMQPLKQRTLDLMDASLLEFPQREFIVAQFVERDCQRKKTATINSPLQKLNKLAFVLVYCVDPS